MDSNQDSSERSGVDNITFGIAFFGLLLAAAGVVLTAQGLAITGLALLALGLCYFGLKQVLTG